MAAPDRIRIRTCIFPPRPMRFAFRARAASGCCQVAVLRTRTVPSVAVLIRRSTVSFSPATKHEVRRSFAIIPLAERQPWNGPQLDADAAIRRPSGAIQGASEDPWGRRSDTPGALRTGIRALPRAQGPFQAARTAEIWSRHHGRELTGGRSTPSASLADATRPGCAVDRRPRIAGKQPPAPTTPRRVSASFPAWERIDGKGAPGRLLAPKAADLEVRRISRAGTSQPKEMLWPHAAVCRRRLRRPSAGRGVARFAGERASEARTVSSLSMSISYLYRYNSIERNTRARTSKETSHGAASARMDRGEWIQKDMR